MRLVMALEHQRQVDRRRGIVDCYAFNSYSRLLRMRKQLILEIGNQPFVSAKSHIRF